MEMALSEITLVLFTTIAPVGIVGFCLVALYACIANAADATKASRYLVIPLAFVISGLIASATHLGTPANALYVLTGVGRSPLSNEVVAVVAFLAIAGTYWIASFRDDWKPLGRRIALGISMVLGAVALQAMAVAYSVEWVPTWNLPTAPITLWLGCLAPGVVLGLLTLHAAHLAPSKRFAYLVLALGFAAMVADLVVLGMEWGLLGSIATTVSVAADLVPFMPAVMGGFAVLSAAGLVILASLSAGKLSLSHGWWLAVASAALLLMLAGCFAVRFCFYAMYMTAGL